MKEEKIATLHPTPGKVNKVIAKSKYDFIRSELVTILQSAELTHTDLMESLYIRVKEVFEGGVQWYGEVVKLDLEARGILERTKSKPEKYRLKTQTNDTQNVIKPCTNFPKVLNFREV